MPAHPTHVQQWHFSGLYCCPLGAVHARGGFAQACLAVGQQLAPPALPRLPQPHLCTRTAAGLLPPRCSVDVAAGLHTLALASQWMLLLMHSCADISAGVTPHAL
mmetsp:Transcript_13541/g.39218  ORF Transcript_13541/g.39218 Transcript_13541/m.39218 type:complete len:105 (-) Transcript_13541:94-408(-)